MAREKSSRHWFQLIEIGFIVPKIRDCFMQFWTSSLTFDYFTVNLRLIDENLKQQETWTSDIYLFLDIAVEYQEIVTFNSILRYYEITNI